MTSSINQMRMNMIDLQNIQALKSNKPNLQNLIEDSTKEKIYAKHGEESYNKAMDFDGDGVVTYDEYMRYCDENAVSQYSSNPSYTYVSIAQNLDNQNVRPVHIGRALDTYSHFGEEEFLPFVETEV